LRRLTPELRALYRQEFIGSDVRITDSGHPGYLSISGKVMNETKNTFHIATDSGVRIVPKAGNVFQIQGHEIVGKQIMFRPEERVKKFR